MIERIYGTIDVNGTKCPITNIFDIDGDDTDDFALATSGVAQLPNGEWLSFKITIDTLPRLEDLS